MAGSKRREGMDLADQPARVALLQQRAVAIDGPGDRILGREPGVPTQPPVRLVRRQQQHRHFDREIAGHCVPRAGAEALDGGIGYLAAVQTASWLGPKFQAVENEAGLAASRCASTR